MSKEDAYPSLETIVSLCKRKGFVFQTADIYGGLNGVYDFGHLGYLLKENIKKAWKKSLYTKDGQVLFLGGSLIGPEAMWQASGHISNFHDPLIDNKDSKKRYRVDQLLEDQKDKVIDTLLSILFQDNKPDTSDTEQLMSIVIAELFKHESVSGQLLKDAGVIDPHSGAVGNWTNIRNFNLMFKTQLGALQDGSSDAYLRPETAQTIFINFKNMISTNRVKLPFGIAQIGKSFRNEITPKQFLFRMREFEQMEIEWFCLEQDALQEFEKWKQRRKDFYTSIGIDESKLQFHEHSKDELAHYSVCCTDIQYKFPFGFKELEGIAHRGTFDLTQHSTHSGKELSIFDPQTNQTHTPVVIESSVGVDRLFLTVLFDAYCEDEMGGEKRIVLKLHPRIAPVKAAILPLTKKLSEQAMTLFDTIRTYIPDIQFDEAGSIGKRYRRQDEIGTPFCITFDFDSLEDHSVTIRERDTGSQTRVHQDQLIAFLLERIA